MKVIATAEQVKITELDDFNKFHIEATGTLEQISNQFQTSRAGHVMNSEHAEVNISFIKQQAGEKLQDSTWLNGLKMMLDYADSKGWMNQEHQTVVAHIEWETAVISEM